VISKESSIGEPMVRNSKRNQRFGLHRQIETQYSVILSDRALNEEKGEGVESLP
jgi:hypothetical protein